MDRNILASDSAPLVGDGAAFRTDRDALKRIKCEVTTTTLLPCWALDRAIEDVVGGKGVRFHQLRDIVRSGLAPTRAFVSLHSGDFKKQGVVMNHCPFCGTDIGSHMKGDVAPTTKQERTQEYQRLLNTVLGLAAGECECDDTESCDNCVAGIAARRALDEWVLEAPAKQEPRPIGSPDNWIAPFHVCPRCQRSLNWFVTTDVFDREVLGARCECGLPAFYAFFDSPRTEAPAQQRTPEET